MPLPDHSISDAFYYATNFKDRAIGPDGLTNFETYTELRLQELKSFFKEQEDDGSSEEDDTDAARRLCGLAKPGGLTNQGGYEFTDISRLSAYHSQCVERVREKEKQGTENLSVLDLHNDCTDRNTLAEAYSKDRNARPGVKKEIKGLYECEKTHENRTALLDLRERLRNEVDVNDHSIFPSRDDQTAQSLDSQKSAS